MNINPRIDRGQRRRMKRLLQKTSSRIEALRARVLLLLHGGLEPSQVAEAVGCARTTVYRTLYRYEDLGEEALFDRRKARTRCAASTGVLAASTWCSTTSSSTSRGRRFVTSPASVAGSSSTSCRPIHRSRTSSSGSGSSSTTTSPATAATGPSSHSWRPWMNSSREPSPSQVPRCRCSLMPREVVSGRVQAI